MAGAFFRIGDAMTKYLNAQSKFKCAAGNAVFFKPQNDAGNVRTNSSGLLLETCMLKLIGAPVPGQCPFTPNPATGTPPGPCASVTLPPMWKNNSTVKVKMIRVLKSDCSLQCPLGGNIQPFSPTHKFIRLADAADVSSFDIPSADDPSTHNQSKQKPSSNQSVGGQFVNSALSKIADAVDDIISSTVEHSTVEKKNAVETAVCDYKNCDRTADCEYLKASAQTLDVDSAKLASNMKKHCADYQSERERISGLSIDGAHYSVAHHHMIPGNQCFKKFPRLVKLANFYGYDINNHLNGIALPSINEGVNDLVDHIRIAFNAMQRLGLQWHKSHHQFSLDKLQADDEDDFFVIQKLRAEFDRLFKNERSIKIYTDAVNELLETVDNHFIKRSKCPMEDREAGAKEFHAAMNEVDDIIRQKLSAFKDNPRDSYSFFVSKMAIYFAYHDRLSGHEDLLFEKGR